MKQEACPGNLYEQHSRNISELQQNFLSFPAFCFPSNVVFSVIDQMFLNDRKFSHYVNKYRRVNPVTASFNTNTGQ